MFVGIGVGIGRQRFGGGIFSEYAARVVADGGVTEAGSCVDAVSTLLQTASLLLVPSGYKSTKVYSQIPTNGNGDLTWTRASTANRTNSSGNIELMATGVPRLSYMYGSCPALLLEPQRTNLVLRSEEFNVSAIWTNIIGGTGVNPSITTNAVISPDGTQNAETVVFDRGAGNLISNQSTLEQSVTIPTTGAYIFSIYAKASSAGDVGKQIFLRLGGAGALVSITLTANWVRYFRAESSVLSGVGIIQIGNRGTVTANNTVSVDLYGAQLEAGAYATTYIPTTTATVTRIADSFTRNNIYTNGLITSSGGTWFVQLQNNLAYTRDASSASLFIDTISGGLTNGFTFRNGGGANRLSITKAISGVLTILHTTTTDIVKVAIKWNGTTADVFVNGTKQVSATAFTTTNMEFLATPTTQDVPKFIQQMALYSSPLSDSDCIALTTL